MIDMGSVIVGSLGVDSGNKNTVQYSLTACDYAVIYGLAYTSVSSNTDEIYFNYKTMIAKGGTCVILGTDTYGGSNTTDITLTLNSDGTSLTVNPGGISSSHSLSMHFTVISYKYKS